MAVHEGQAGQGRTRWPRFIAMLLVGSLAAGALFLSMSSGAVAASFTISGALYKLAGSELRGTGMTMYGTFDQGSDRAYPVFITGFRKVEADDFCQSVVVDPIPGLGEYTIRIDAPGRAGFAADNLVAGFEKLGGDLTLEGAQLGHDAGQFDKGPEQARGIPGSFGIQTDGLVLRNVSLTARSTTATTIRLNRVNISATPGRHECF